MIKKTYVEPALQIVKLQQRHIICTSTYGMSDTLQQTTVSSAWSRSSNGFDDEE